jgi:hypothetical protein
MGFELDTLWARKRFVSSMRGRDFEGEGEWALPLVRDDVLVVKEGRKATLGGAAMRKGGRERPLIG